MTPGEDRSGRTYDGRDERSDRLVSETEGRADAGSEEPDVLLDVPILNVEEIELEVEDLELHVSARAELADFVKINVGVDASLNQVKLGIKGVEAQAQLKVKLERILGTIERALDAIAENPSLLESGAIAELSSVQNEAGAEEPRPAPAATDAAERKAEELGVDLSGIRGSGVGGRILLKDVQQAAR